MKVLLIQPPIRDFYRTAFREYPLGLLSIAASLEKSGHAVAILDARRSRHPKTAPLPAALASLPHTDAPFPFPRFQHFGLGFDEVAQQAASAQPDIIGISALFTPYVNEVIATAAAIKAKLPDVPIVVGGHHATVDPASLLTSDAVDQVVLGEGEGLDVERSMSSRGTQATKRSPDIVEIAASASRPPRNDIFRCPDLDALPFPARHLIDPGAYRLGKRRYAMLLTSRGCPHRCSFCSVHAMAGSRHRVRKIDNVLAEIEECVRKHGIEAIDLQDDNLLFDRDRIKELFRRILAEPAFRGVEFLASNGLNAAHLDHELLDLMKRVGFRKLDIALGTGDVAHRERLHRPETLAHYERVLAEATSLDLAVTTYIILGIPTQPLAEMQATIAYLATKSTLIAPSIFYNVPGMPIFEEMQAYEYSRDHAARRSSAFDCRGIDFDRSDILRLFADIRRSNLARHL